MNKSERDHLSAVAARGCVICGGPAQIHHIREFGEKRNHFKTIGLCHHHHLGIEGIHRLGKKAWRLKYGHEREYLNG